MPTFHRRAGVMVRAGGWVADAAVQEPIRAELFGIERLEQHAASLAAAQGVVRDTGRGSPLLNRVRDNRRVLRAKHAEITTAVREERWITPAAEWLLDNFYIVDEQLREIRDDLPTGFYRELPKLADGPHAGLPRVYGIAWAFVAHTDSRFDPELLTRFVEAYQRVDPLTIGELWAVAITMRVVLVENLRRCAEAIARGMAERERADVLAAELLGSGDEPASPLEMHRLDHIPLSRAFAVELVLRLRDRDPVVTPALAWLDARLAAEGTNADALVDSDHQRQAAMTVTVRNIITSMRLMSSFDWADFVESVSLVDAVLRGNATYGRMDFASRDAYRHAIEQIARGSGRSEIDIARLAIETSNAAPVAGVHGDGEPDGRQQDPGFHLIGNGRRAFERAVGYRLPGMRRLYRAYIDAAIPGYLGSIALLTAAVLYLPLASAHAAGLDTTWLIAMALVALFPASDLAIALVNRSVTAIVPPSLLPRLKLREGVPPEYRTLVAVPTLLLNAEEIEGEIERLEVHYLANPDGDVLYALLSDWTDADAEHTAGDQDLLATAANGIARLNRRHAATHDGTPRFLLFHRRRLWNPRQGKWMGWERKRGKLHELNRLLRGATDTTFVAVGEAAVTAPAGVRYVVTLDSDTRIPIGAVSGLVGTMVHPLNRPRFDPATRRVVEGYAILQPRVTPPLPGRAGSRYQRLMSGPSGIDPYASAVSDVYQDIFGEGTFTGKGIYDIDAFEAALTGRVPENRLLSHDLYEGIFARAGLVTDIELFEQAPASYSVAAARQHRWVRGDWQLLPWLLARGVPPVARWKMLDNMRRSLSAPGAYLTFVAAWVLVGSAPLSWMAFLAGTIAIPTLIPVVGGVIPRGRGISKRSHFRALRRDLDLALWQTAIALTMLAHQAWVMADAILRTLGRVLVTHRNLLEWTTAAQSAGTHRVQLGDFVRRMAGGLIVAGVAAAAIGIVQQPGWPAALPLLALWAAAPVIAHRISVSQLSVRTTAVDPLDARLLRLIARRTWRFFSTFVSADDRWLPPDNFQETPNPVVAHRTSPTNMGLSLLSTVAAHDFGWIGLHDLVDRLEATVASMRTLDRHRGHWYNWYDTRDGRALDPRYISSVDSGNLAGALIALANTCRQLIDQPFIGPMALAGVDDTAQLLRMAVRDAAEERTRSSAERRRFADALDELTPTDASGVRSVPDYVAALEAVTTGARRMLDRVLTSDRELQPHDDIGVWTTAVIEDATSHLRDVEALAPWARLGAAAHPALAPLAQAYRLSDLPAASRAVTSSLQASRDAGSPDTEADGVLIAVEQGGNAATALIARLRAIAREASDMVDHMDFRFLFDPTRKLFSIGYRVHDDTLDPGWYDLLASEARLLSYVAIAKGDAPVSHWFRLGRSLTPVGRDSVLMSWSGSMFEYLMPALLMRTPVGSLLEQTCRLVVRRQITYGDERDVPWGVSESGYSARDLEMTYKYSAFGVPGLGLKRGLGDAIVITPHATGLATMIDPAAAARNFTELQRAGALGAYGFYEAIDYTASRRPPGARGAIVRSYMAHHQGMLLVGITNALHDGLMRSRFHAEPMVQATELLLQERTPRDVAVARPHVEEFAAVGDVREPVPAISRTFRSPHAVTPRTHLLSNGRYAVMITSAGAGYSRWSGLAVTRWREDVTLDDTGTFFFLRDVATGESWSAGFQPRGVEPSSYEVAFREDRAELMRRDGTLVTRLEVIVSGEDDAELRLLSVTNEGTEARELDVTSYAEIVLAPHAADVAHPAFSNLFVSTEAIPESNIVLATRRQRSPEEEAVWLGHVVAVAGETVGALQWETDRRRFIGRGNPLRLAVGATSGDPLSNTVGPVLDPIVSLRRRVRIPAGRTVRLCYSTFVGRTRDAMLDLADKYQDLSIFERAATLSWTRAQVQMHHVGIGPNEAHLFQELAGSLLYADRAQRAPAEILTRQRGGAPMLWPHGISGDLPIIVVTIDNAENTGIVRQLLRAHQYWRMKRLAVDLVIINDRATSYLQDLHGLLQTLIRANPATGPHEGPDVRGSAYLLRADQLTAQQRDVLMAAARVVLSAQRGLLADQVSRIQRSATRANRAVVPASPLRMAPRTPLDDAPVDTSGLQFFNGHGGFDRGGSEYVVVTRPGHPTPLPWVNVLANEQFGALVSESGTGCTWAHNSQSNRLTPWSNDPVSDPPSEVMYVRDEESGVIWAPTARPLPARGGEFVARHGAGYTRFERVSHGIALELLQFVAADDPVKVARLTLVNRSDRVRQLTVTGYAELVLGSVRSATSTHVVTEIDPVTGALFATNSWNDDFAEQVAFIDLGGKQESLTGDRAEFLGRNGSMAHPEALRSAQPLSGRVGAGRDPAAAMQQRLTIDPGERADVVFVIGQAPSRMAAAELVMRWRNADLVAKLAEVTDRWDAILGAVQVTTPEPSMDVMLNRWLVYQVLACRVWARAGFYQSSGAYGFRDQLQDVMALALTRPDVARQQVLRAAARQFVEGDVQHWWHPPTGKGVRTRFSDDLLWLPYVVAHHVDITADLALLDEQVPFIEGPPLTPELMESYFEPWVSASRASIFEHCARTIDRSLAAGPHGLPLIGCGDWNDGMNHVGVEGRGESVWMGWFLHVILERWSAIAESRGEHERVSRWRERMRTLRVALDEHGWDGAWFRRAYFDDGTPLGSHLNDECRIDAIAQSWSVISGAAEPARQRMALDSMAEHLVRKDDGLIALLAPPFDTTDMEPGYIKGYLPGIRENGAQYTHAAAWAVIANALLGDGDAAMGMFGLINPVNHTDTPEGAQRYQGEPYVLAGDVYSTEPHVGRAGWSWYSGSAAWLYRAGIESILGVTVRGDQLVLTPCIPSSWPGFTVTLRYRSATYRIAIENPDRVMRGVAAVTVDGHDARTGDITMIDDGAVHDVRVRMG